MRRGVFLIVCFLALVLPLRAQLANTNVSNGSGAPVGACVSGSLYVDSSTGLAWGCTGSAWSSLAPIASPALTGTPTAPTAGSTTNTTQLATTAFVQTAVGGITGVALRRTSTGVADGSTTTLNQIGDVIVNTGAPSISAVGISTQNTVGISYAPTGTGTSFGESGNLNYNSVKNVVWTFFGAPGRTTNERYWFGLSDQTVTTMGNSDNPAGNYAAFRFSTVAGDSHYICITKDGTTQATADSGITPKGYLDSTGNGVNFTVNLVGSAGTNTSAVFSINGAQVCSISTHLPNSGVAVGLRSIVAANNSTSNTNAGILFNELVVTQDLY